MMNEPMHVISLGAGTQSTVMLLMACEGLIEPMPTAAIFADTGWEPQGVYEHLDWLESVSSIPIIRTSNGRSLYDDTWNGVGHDDHTFTSIPVFALTKSGDMQLSRRQCTQNYKIRPIQSACRELLGRRRGARSGPTAVQWIGISTDEAMRIKPSRVGWIENRWPLIDAGMSRADCVRWFEDRYPGRVLVKSSCVGCPFHSDTEWLRLYREEPADMDLAIALDGRLRSDARPKDANTLRLPEFLHRKGPLKDVLEKLDRDDRAGQQLPLLDGFGNECEGHCGV